MSNLLIFPLPVRLQSLWTELKRDTELSPGEKLPGEAAGDASRNSPAPTPTCEEVRTGSGGGTRPGQVFARRGS